MKLACEDILIKDELGLEYRRGSGGDALLRCAVAVWALVLLLGVRTAAEFVIEDDGRSIHVKEDRRSVLVYNYLPTTPPEGMDAERWQRGAYIHPLLGFYGEELTEDYPEKRPEERGVFWSWPRILVGDREMDLWSHEGAHQVFERISNVTTSDDLAVIDVQNAWIFDDTDRAQVIEYVEIIVHAANTFSRSIDITLELKNVSDSDIVLQGEERTGQGGLAIRLRAPYKSYEFTTSFGRPSGDVLRMPTPWADVSFRQARSSRYYGVAIFQHPRNPGFPHSGWIMRHYGLLVASWPHTQPYRLAVGESVVLRYRIFVHQGHGENVGLPTLFKEFVDAHK